MCILLRCVDIFNFVMRHRVWTTHHLCKNSLDFKLLLEIGNSEYDIGIDGKIARPKLSLDSESAWRQLQRPTTPRQPFIIFFPLQHHRRGHHRYCHHLRHHIEVTALLFVDSAPHTKLLFWAFRTKCIKSSRQSHTHLLNQMQCAEFFLAVCYMNTIFLNTRSFSAIRKEEMKLLWQ